MRKNKINNDRTGLKVGTTIREKKEVQLLN